VVATFTLQLKMSNLNRSAGAATKHHNRVAAIMLHTARYSCCPTSRLAGDVGVAKSTISHLVHGRTNPLYSTAARVVKCLERELGHPLDVREVFSEDGSYPTSAVCKVANCPGCLPDGIYELDGSRKVEFKEVVPGKWSGDTTEFQPRTLDTPEALR
jgi:hypothetical protein